jgi:amidase
MDRRVFLKRSLAGGCAVAGAPAALRLDADAASVSAEPFELEESSLAGLQEKMKTGALTSVSLTEKYLARIEQIDKSGPKVNCVIELNPEAVAIARRADEERKAGRVRGPLHGIPVFIKDNIDTADRMSTTAGSLALSGSVPQQDAFIVRRLREAGAVILGKTNLSEWANFRSSKSTSGWSGRGGLTRNPYVLDRNACGSSSGSGAAVSANLCVVAVGTETDGSIICPSSTNGIVGIKPTLGLVSRSGIIPIAHSQDTAGPMARSVADAAHLLGVLAGPDPSDPYTKAAQGRPAADYSQFLDSNGLKSARIGVARKFFGFNERVDKLMEEALQAMKRLGAELIDPADVPTTGKFDDSENEVLLFEFKADLNAYLTRLGPKAPVRSLQDIIQFNEQNREREMPFFGQDLFVKAQAKGPLTADAYRKALARGHRLSRTEGIDAVLKKHRLDALIAPTGGPAWLTDLINGDHFTGGSSTPAAVAGYPNINVPAGFVFGLPVGISFFGTAWSEPKLIKLAYSFEQATRLRKPPRFLPTVDLRET